MVRKFCLLVIDLQQDFLPPDGSLAIAEGRDVIPLINGLTKPKFFSWSAVVATQDWHPPDHCSFASQHQVEPFTEVEFRHPLSGLGEGGRPKTQKHVVWPDHCVQGSFGAELDKLFVEVFEDIESQIPKTIVRKGQLKDREFYSCFADVWKVLKTETEEFLKGNGITDVVIVGLAYDYCVGRSALDCQELGFATYVVKECSRSAVPLNTEEIDQLLVKAGVKLISIDDLSLLRKDGVS